MLTGAAGRSGAHCKSYRRLNGRKILDVVAGDRVVVDRSQRIFFEIGQNLGDPVVAGAVARDGGRKAITSRVVIVDADADLPEIIEALRPAARLAGLLDGRQQNAGERANDRDDDERLDERHAAGGTAAIHPFDRSRHRAPFLAIKKTGRSASPRKNKEIPMKNYPPPA